jgi:hypothetical protein
MINEIGAKSHIILDFPLKQRFSIGRLSINIYTRTTVVYYTFGKNCIVNRELGDGGENAI